MSRAVAARFFFFLMLLLFLTGYATSRPNDLVASKNFYNGQFHNLNDIKTWSWQGSWSALKRWLFETHLDTTPAAPLPVRKLTAQVLQQDLANYPGDRLYWLGHSSILLYLDQRYWLIDPIFSNRASPFSFYGPQRFQPSPISIDQLPPLAGVIVSHNHYDHLDQATIEQLIDKTEHFYMPLQVGQYLQKWGVAKERITELDWWQSVENGKLKLVATPAQHFSGRGITDRGKSLWASWVIQSPTSNIFFSGDSGYFPGFKMIGNRYGPFDLTLIEAGAYDQDWQEVHMLPRQSLQAHQDLAGRCMLPIHNGVFDLAFHPWFEPYRLLKQLADSKRQCLITPLQGQQVLPVQGTAKQQYQSWWDQLEVL